MKLQFDSLEECVDFVRSIEPEKDASDEACIDDLSRSIYGIYASGSKIHAIKVMRAATGLGLKDAKEAVERHWPHVFI